MALKDLLTALEADAAAETERLHAETEAEAARIVESAQLEASSLEQQAARADEADLAHVLERRRSEARLAAAATLRDAHEASVETLQDALRRRLAALRGTEAYPGVFRALLDEGLAAVPSASVLRVDPRDAQLAREIVRELNVRLELKPDLDTLGGVEAVASDGRTVRNTFEERLRNAEPSLRVLAGEVLGAEETPS
ncbi:MAG TPA: V-type ATP synthase subunit E [Gaiellaceae bacterium]|nr:V-type ATP synthase subunit E [Gaiellaceae bacterium]